MSSRLPYQSLAFKEASQGSESLKQWEQSAYQEAQKNLGPAASINQLLAAAELAIRCQDAERANDLIKRTLSKSPTEADAHFLKTQLLQGQQAPADILKHLKTTAPRLTQKKVDHARLHRLLAEELWKQDQDLTGASRAIRRAFECAGPVDFVHCKTMESLDANQIQFDLAIFDALWPWDGRPAEVRFSSVSTDAANQVYVLEHRHQWLFCFDAQGRFIKGITEHQLANVPFLHPEHLWDLTDMATDHAGNHYLCGSSDKIYIYDDQWQEVRQLAPPASQRTLRPLSICVDDEQNVYVIYLHLGGIHRFNAEGFHLGTFGQNTIMPSLGKNYFCGLTLTPEQNICLYDRESIQIFKPGQAQPIQTWFLSDVDSDAMNQDDYPFCWNGVACSDKDIYVCDTYGNQVIALSPDTGSFRILPGEAFLHPFDIAVDQHNVLYLTDTGHGRVMKYKNQKWDVLLSHPAFQGAV